MWERRLRRRRERAVAEVEALERQHAAVVAAAEDQGAVDDEHDPEGHTLGYERAHARALADTARTRVTELDAALARIADGTFGVCAVCRGPIGEARLEVRPHADACVACAGSRRR